MFTPDSDHGAFQLRARHVGCAVARDLARGAEGGDRRYRRAGMRCRGTFDSAGWRGRSTAAPARARA